MTTIKITIEITIGPQPGSLGAMFLETPPPPPADLLPERELLNGREINVYHPAFGYVRALAGKKPLR